MQQIVISLNTPPGQPRPGHLIDALIHGVSVVLSPTSPVTMNRGEWVWTAWVEKEGDFEVVDRRVKTLITEGILRSGEVRLP